MGMTYWLLKTEPEEYSWERLESEKTAAWTGVRNFEARNNLREMKVGDCVFIYHSGEDRIIMGIAKVTKDAYPDPTATKGDWVAVDIEAVKPLVRPVSLEEVRNTYTLNTMPLVSQTRLSVQPVTDAQAVLLLKIGKTSI
jgi:predicted RNA-binding protein with PUA-like domain